MVVPHVIDYPKAALVTGAGKRIGRAIALSLAEAGWAVAVHHHESRGEADAVVRAIVAGGGKAVALAADLASEDQVAPLVGEATARLGPLGCLVNNASIFENDHALDVTRQSWDRHLEVNLRAPFVLSQELARQLPADKHGCIINILDERVWSLTPFFFSYTLAKSALWTMTQTLALALAPRIRVNGIGPGPTLPSPRQSEAQFQRQASLMPLGRGTTPEEIAQAVMFILAAPALTGQMIALDGGQHLGWAQAAERRAPEE
jgi:NAD(P)-dependent dehydrogenase (short-subunit alcohol dehydrogenase family)